MGARRLDTPSRNVVTPCAPCYRTPWPSPPKCRRKRPGPEDAIIARSGPFLVIAIAAITLSVCVNPNRMFTGRWISESTVSIGNFEGSVELGLGHYGPDLVGVARFYDTFGRPYTPCPCVIVESRGVRIGDGAFTAVSDRCGAEVWLWSLTIDLAPDPATLVGTVVTDQDQTVEVAFEQTDDFVEEAFRACTP